MKKSMNHVVAILVALLVLCAPVGAMADELYATLALSNLDLSIGENFNANVDVTAQLDLSIDSETGTVTGMLTALAGKDKALKGGFAFDAATMNLMLGLEGMTDAIFVPMGDMVSQMQTQMSGALSQEELEKVTGMLNAVSTFMTVLTPKMDAMTAQLQPVINSVMARIIADAGETTVTIEDVELPAHEYIIVVTAEDVAEIVAASGELFMSDPELVAALQALVDEISAISGTESIDVSAMDIDQLTEQLQALDISCTADVYVIDEKSFLIDWSLDQGDQTLLPAELIVLTDEESSYICLSVDIDDGNGSPVSLTIEADIPVDGTPKFSFVITGTQGTDAYKQDIMFSLEGDFSDGASLTAYAQTISSYSYNGSEYSTVNAMGVSYAGDTIIDESGISYPGTLVLYINSNGQEFTVSADTLLSLNNASTVDFEMPRNLINIENADADTMNALAQEAMTVLQKGLMILMGAPGMEKLMPMLQGQG